MLKGQNKKEAYLTTQLKIKHFIQENNFDVNEIKLFKRVLVDDISGVPENEIYSSGYVLHSLEASLWCIHTTESYEDAVLKAVNLGDDTDTTAAITGGLAGLIYGFNAIPESWLNVIIKKEEIEKLCLEMDTTLIKQQKYTVEDIKKGDKFLMFWGHQPAPNGEITKTCFSQWWLSSFVHEGVNYKTAEHWMMAKKAELFGDTTILAKILNAKTPAEAKKLGREVNDYDDDIWVKSRFEIVRQGNYLKFSQNEALKDYLLATDKRILVEASPVDSIWGIGLAHDHPDATYPEKWKGLNLLGFALMQVRDELKK